MKNPDKVLMYHSVRPYSNSSDKTDTYSVSVSKFREQMQAVHRKSIVITFDDGYLDNYTCAYPALSELNIQAYFFIVISKVGTPGFMNWKQIKELSNKGMIIGSHGMKHQILVGLDNKELDYELVVSKKILEERLGHGIKHLSIPYGHHNTVVTQKAKEAGYKSVFTSNPEDTDGFRYGRIAVRGSWDLDYFIRIINDGYSMKDRIKERLKNSSKKILGADTYHKFRTTILKNR